VASWSGCFSITLNFLFFLLSSDDRRCWTSRVCHLLVILLRVRGIALSEVIATFALGVGILSSSAGWDSSPTSLRCPYLKKGTFLIVGVPLDYQRLFIIGIGLALVLFLYFFTHFTRNRPGIQGHRPERANSDLARYQIGFYRCPQLGLWFGDGCCRCHCHLPLGIISINTGYEVLLIAVAVGIVEDWKAFRDSRGKPAPGYASGDHGYLLQT